MRISFLLLTVLSGQSLSFPGLSLGTQRLHRKFESKVSPFAKERHNLNLLGSSTIYPRWSGASWVTAWSIWSQALPLRRDQCYKNGLTDICTTKTQPEDPHQNGFSELSQNFSSMDPALIPGPQSPLQDYKGLFRGAKGIINLVITSMVCQK